MNNLIEAVNYYRAGLMNNCLIPLGLNDNVTDNTSNIHKLAPYKDILSEQTKNYLMRNINDLDYVIGLVNMNRSQELLLGSLLQGIKSDIKKYAPEDIINTLNNGLSYAESPRRLKLLLKAYKFLRENHFSINSPTGINILKFTKYCMENDFYALFDSINPETIIKISYMQSFRCINNITNFAQAVSENENYVWLCKFIAERGISSFTEDIIKIKNPKRITNIFCKMKVRYKGVKDIDCKITYIIKHFIGDNYNPANLGNFYKNINAEMLDNYTNEEINYYNVVTDYKYNNLVKAAKDSQMRILVMQGFKEKKHNFLRTLEQTNSNELDISSKSLFAYGYIGEAGNYLNLNELNRNDVLEIASLSCTRVFSQWEKGKLLTPKEYITITKSPLQQSFKVYSLLDGSIDDKLLAFKQLANIGFNIKDYEEAELTNIFGKINEKNIYKRIDEMPVKVTPEVMFDILALPDTYDNLINQAESMLELEFICRNKNSIETEGSLRDIMRNYISMDYDCNRLFTLTDCDMDFVEQYKATIEEFCFKGNASITMKYYDSSDSKNRNSILRIAKADMMGELESFKFFNISKEIEAPLSEEKECIWKENLTFVPKKGYKIYETYSFKDTMCIGELPTHTCMSYKDGSYSNCLLANFDSNKKILYVKKEGKIVGRAIIRLTKSIPGNANVSKQLSFNDYDNVQENVDEELSIFLERPYFGYINEKEEDVIKKYICSFIRDKCVKLGAKFIACDDYDDCGLKKDVMKVFITHTKNGVQYMDSFSGQNNYSLEARYVSCSCYV